MWLKRTVVLFMALLCAIVPAAAYAEKSEGVNQGREVKRAVHSEQKAGSKPADLTKMQLDRPFTKQNVRKLFSNTANYEEGRVVITFMEDAAESEKQQVLKRHRLKFVEQIKNSPFVLAEAENKQDLASVASKLAGYDIVDYVEPNAKVERTFIPRDARYAKQWHLPKIEAPKAWDITRGAANVVVAVIDGGVQKNHPKLKSAIVSPYNMVTGTTNYVPDDHGTHVAGIIAAAFNNQGTVGIAPNVKIMPINVFKGEEADAFTVSKAIMHAADKGADIINLSLGGTDYSSTADYAVQYASAKGATIIAASGNEKSGRNMYPAANKNVIAVSAISKKDRLASFSNYGKYIDVSAPGEGILSTGARSDFIIMDGTSMAAPIVSGTAALLLSKNPFLTGAEVEKVLKSTAVDLGKRGWDSSFGNGRVNAYKALGKAAAPLANFSLSSALYIDGSAKKVASFTVAKNRTVSVALQNAKGQTVKKWKAIKSNGTPISLSWEGMLDNRKYAEDGKYKLVIVVFNDRASYRTVKDITVHNQVNQGPVLDIRIPEVVFFYPGNEEAAEIFYYMGQPAKVTVEVLNKQKQVVRLLLKNEAVQQGYHSVVWNGLNDQGKMEMETEYTYRMTVTNQTGATNTMEGVLSSTAASPPWLQENIYEQTESGMNFHVTVAKQAKMHVLAYEDPNYTVEIGKQLFNLKSGKQTLAYQKPKSGKLYYLAVFEDELGNTYWYEVEE